MEDVGHEEDEVWYEVQTTFTHAVQPEREEVSARSEVLGGGYYVALGVDDEEEDEAGSEVGLDVQKLMWQAEEAKAQQLREWGEWQQSQRLLAGMSDQVQQRLQDRRLRIAGSEIQSKARWERVVQDKRLATTVVGVLGLFTAVSRVWSGEGWGVRQMVQWGFTVWSWWTRWSRQQMAGVMKAVNEGDFQEMVWQQTGTGGLPLMTPRKYEVQGAAQRSAAQDGGRMLGGRKLRGSKQGIRFGGPRQKTYVQWQWMVSVEGLAKFREYMDAANPFWKWYKAQWRVQLTLLAAQYRINRDKAKIIEEWVHENVARHSQEKGGTECVCVEYLTLMKERLLQGVLVTIVQYIAFRAVILVWRTRAKMVSDIRRMVEKHVAAGNIIFNGKRENGKGSEKSTARLWKVPLYG